MSIQIIAGQSQEFEVKGWDAAGNEVAIPAGTTVAFVPTSTVGDIGTLATDPSIPLNVTDTTVVAGSTGTIAATATFPSGKVLSAVTDEIDVIAPEPASITITPVAAQ
jgi:hypothetical protein